MRYSGSVPPRRDAGGGPSRGLVSSPLDPAPGAGGPAGGWATEGPAEAGVLDDLGGLAPVPRHRFAGAHQQGAGGGLVPRADPGQPLAGGVPAPALLPRP